MPKSSGPLCAINACRAKSENKNTQGVASELQSFKANRVRVSKAVLASNSEQNKQRPPTAKSHGGYSHSERGSTTPARPDKDAGAPWRYRSQSQLVAGSDRCFLLLIKESSTNLVLAHKHVVRWYCGARDSDAQPAKEPVSSRVRVMFERSGRVVTHPEAHG